MPFARGRSAARSISGRMPYFAGPKNALCVPIRNSTVNSPVRPNWPYHKKPSKPSNMITISATFADTTTVRLLKRSET